MSRSDAKSHLEFFSILLVFFCFYVVCSSGFVRVYEVTGDEPLYLLMVHSLVYDGDFDLADNFERNDYRAFYSYELSPELDHQAIDFLGDGVLLSKHDLGLPLLVAPFYWLAGRWGVVIFQNLVTALTVTLCWRWTLRHLRRRLVSAFVCVGLGCSIPVLLFSTQIFPEAVAALFTLWGVTQLDPYRRPPMTRWRLLGYSAVIGFLPWLSVKYAVISAVFMLAGISLLKAHRSKRDRLSASLCLIGPALLAGMIWIYVRLRFYGAISPSAQYTDFQFNLAQIDQHLLGLLLDQEHGLLPYAPVYGLALPGLAIMWRRGQRALVILIVVIFGSFLALIAAWHCWWGGWCFPARFLTAVLPILALPVAYVSETVLRPRWLLVPSAIVITGIVVVGILLGLFGLNDPVYRLLNRRDGSANLFLDLGPRQFDWPSVLPSYPPYSPVVRFRATTTDHDVGQDVADPTLPQGTQVRFAPAGSPAGYLVRDAREVLAAGRYQVCVRVRTEEALGVVGVLGGRTIGHQPTKTVFELSIRGSSSVEEAEYRHECGEMWIPRRELIAFHFWSMGTVDVHVYQLTFERLGPWSPAMYSVRGQYDLADGGLVPYLGDGWSVLEPWGRWAIGAHSEVYVHLEDRVATELTMSVFPFVIEGSTQRMDVYYNDHLLEEFVLEDPGGTEIRVVIPQQAITRGVDVLRFEYAYARSPAESDGSSGDQRRLAVGFVSLQFSPQPQQTPIASR